MVVTVINPYDFPVRPRHTRYQRACQVVHVLGLLLATAACFTAAVTAPDPHLSPVYALSFAMVMLASMLLGLAGWFGVQAIAMHTPRRATVHLFGHPSPVKLRLRLDLDLPADTYRAYLRGQPWQPPGKIKSVVVNDLSPGQGLAFGPVVFSYDEAVRRFRHCRR